MYELVFALLLCYNDLHLLAVRGDDGVGVRFFHTADLQIGMKAAHVARVADAARKARIETAGRIAALAKEHDVDFLLIAGDLFEDNAVGNDVVHQVLHALEKAAPIPVYILPGNHDLLTSGSVYERAAFRSGPPNVHVLRSTEPVPVAGGKAALLPAPVQQKNSERDPTRVFLETSLATQGVIKIGAAHGSPRIEGKHQPDDHPIALDAAERSGLDYLALGHWHSWLQLSERMLMPGTPEPTAFGETSGFAALVTIDAPGAPPAIERIPVAGLRWEERSFDAEVGAAVLDRQIKEWVAGLGDAGRTLVRVRIFGPMSSDVQEVLGEIEDWLSARAMYSEVDVSGTSLAMSDGRMLEIAAAHPFVAGLLADLSALAAMASPERVDEALLRQTAAASDQLSAAARSDWQALRRILEERDLPLELDVISEALRQLAYCAGEVWK